MMVIISSMLEVKKNGMGMKTSLNANHLAYTVLFTLRRRVIRSSGACICLFLASAIPGIASGSLINRIKETILQKQVQCYSGT